MMASVVAVMVDGCMSPAIHRMVVDILVAAAEAALVVAVDHHRVAFMDGKF